MDISQIQLRAFQEAAKHGSFTRAAAALHITQSALSHRIKNLERDLETTLFIRQAHAIKLTPQGEKLLRFCKIQSQLESEFLATWKQTRSDPDGLSGSLRIAGISTLMRSVVLPSVAALIEENPNLDLELFVRELGELPQLLSSGQADFVLTSRKIALPSHAEFRLGQETYVLVEGLHTRGKVRSVYLDHDPDDQTTFDFLALQTRKVGECRRAYMNGIDLILDGAAEGLGRAVVPLHLLCGRKDLRIVEGLKPMKVPVYLYHLHQPFYIALQRAALERMLKGIPPRLLSKRSH